MRKVLGASVFSIVQLINREFVVILMVAIFFGGGGGFLLTNELLNNLYAQHVEVGVWAIAVSSFVIFAIGIVTTSGTIFKAAVTNPTETLRSE